MPAFRVVPALDLRAGQVVHARGGPRAAYRPLRSDLCAGADPVVVVAGLLAVADFPVIYLADLDAISGGAADERTPRRLRRAFGGLELWVDRGVAEMPGLRAFVASGAGVAVIGSECGPAPDLLAGGPDAVILSLDHRDGRLIDPRGTVADPAGWPGRVIVMELDRVGGGAGPDLVRLDEVRARAGARRVFAAGGVRDGRDLVALVRRGAAGALVASALHDGRIGRAEILAAERAARDRHR